MWQLLFEIFLKSTGFTPLPSDPSIITNRKVIINKLVLVVYINDLLIAKEYKKDIVYIKQPLKT